MASERFTVLVTGAGGQLGREIVDLDVPGIRLIGMDRSRLDVTDAASCSDAVAETRPDAIIHAAAYTAVDRAEDEPEAAFSVNAQGARHMAEAAQAAGARFCYVSTDYVFDGTLNRPYREDDPTGPKSVYGKSKLEGELQALQWCERTFVVRSSWLYARHGANFVRTMLRLAEQGRPLKVVNDQTGSPTYTKDLAVFLALLVQTSKYGIYHASNAGSCTWYQFALAVFEECGIKADVAPCRTEEFPRPAPRPDYSALANTAMAREGFAPFRHWREALRDCLRGG